MSLSEYKYSNIVVILFVSIFIITAFRQTCFAKEPLIWLNAGQIPAYIQKGDYKGKGIIDQTIQLIHEVALTEYEPQYLNVNHQRFNIEAKKENNCYAGWKTFSDYRIFSDPFAIWFPSGIIIHQRNRDVFGAEGSILALKNLIQRTDLKLGIVEDFAYSPAVQKILSTQKQKKHVYANRTSSMQIDLTMLLNERVDYIIGWPSQPIVTKKLKKVGNEFVFYNMEEDQAYIYIGVSCGKCETGNKIIEKINAMFQNQENLLKVQSFVEEWVILSNQYKALYQQTIIDKKTNPLVTHMVYPQ
ncbi:MAG: hypothetical protein K8S18_02960 [Desulfobacula sp.]|nr:hypothetical protein [Desulfobacula sp.]